MERADVRRPVAEELESDVRPLLHLEPDRRADRDRQPGTDDGHRRRCSPSRSRSGASSRRRRRTRPLSCPSTRRRPSLGSSRGRGPRRGRGTCSSGRRRAAWRRSNRPRPPAGQAGGPADRAAHEELLNLVLEMADADHRREPVATGLCAGCLVGHSVALVQAVRVWMAGWRSRGTRGRARFRLRLQRASESEHGGTRRCPKSNPTNDRSRGRRPTRRV